MAARARNFAHYASIMLNAFQCPLCPKLCRHNRRKPITHLLMDISNFSRGRDPGSTQVSYTSLPTDCVDDDEGSVKSMTCTFYHIAT